MTSFAAFLTPSIFQQKINGFKLEFSSTRDTASSQKKGNDDIDVPVRINIIANKYGL